MKLPKSKEYDHTKDLPGSPSIMDVFGRAWMKAYKPNGKRVWFRFNGILVVIDHEDTPKQKIVRK